MRITKNITFFIYREIELNERTNSLVLKDKKRNNFFLVLRNKKNNKIKV